MLKGWLESFELSSSVPKMVSAVASWLDSSRLNRRKFLVGGWMERRSDALVSDEAAIVIHARPERLNEVKQSITEMHGLAVKGQDSDGRLVAVVTPSTPEHVSVALLSLMDVPGVVNAVLTDRIPDCGENA